MASASMWVPRTKVDWFLTVLRVLALTVVTVGLLAFIAQQIDVDNPFARVVNPDATGLTGPQFRGLVISGFAQGAMYGLIALGYSMVYGVLGFINFAHGEVFMVGAMTGMITSNKLDDAGLWETNFLGSLFFIVAVSMLVCTLTAVIMERVAYRPLRKAPRLIPLITSIGISFFIQNTSVVLLGPTSKAYPDMPDWLTAKRTFLEIEGTKIMVICVAAVAMLGLWLLVERTKTGKAMRAVAEDQEIAGLMGVDVNRTIVKVFAVGGAMAGVVTPSIPVVVMETDRGTRAFSPLNEGLGKALRFGSYDAGTLDRLRRMGAVAGPVLDAALGAVEGLDMVELWAEGLRRGDECHNRNVASSAAVLARLAPAIVAAADRQNAVDVLSYIAANPHFFLAFSIAAAKAIADVTHRSADPGVVTAMSSNGVSLGIRVSGAGDRWFLTDSPTGEPKLFEGYTPPDASPVLGDSFIAETVGLGAFALSAAPAIVSFVGGDPLTASDTVEELRGICRGTSSRFLIPSEGFRGTPIGIDVHKVAATGIAPLANAGLAHREPGRGQVGACLLRLPLQPFAEAAAFLAA